MLFIASQHCIISRSLPSQWCCALKGRTTFFPPWVQMDEPAADVHGGFVLQLDWVHAGRTDSVQSTTGSNDLFIPRSDVDETETGKWKVPFPHALHAT